MPTSTTKRQLPGDFALGKSDMQAAALRVNHAGEYGAQRIYAGQLAVLKDHPEITHMAAQEQVHLATFNKLLPEYGVRPTALLPLWHLGGWAMGAITAALGEKAAMACTVAVESVITEHYDTQLANRTVDPALHGTIQKFRDEEMEHHTIGLAHDAASAPGYLGLTHAIRTICRAAIWLSSRV